MKLIRTKMNDLDELPGPLFRGCIKVMSTIASHLPLNISEIVRDRGLVPRGLVPKDHL